MAEPDLISPMLPPRDYDPAAMERNRILEEARKERDRLDHEYVKAFRSPAMKEVMRELKDRFGGNPWTLDPHETSMRCGRLEVLQWLEERLAHGKMKERQA